MTCSWNLRSADSEGFTALHLAASSGSASMCALLLNLNAPVDVRNQQGRTALGETMDEIFGSWSWRINFYTSDVWKEKIFQSSTYGLIFNRDKRKDTDVGLKMDICGETICFRRLCNWRGPLGSCRAAWCEKAARVFHFHFFDGFFLPKATKLLSSNACAFLVLYCHWTNLYSRVEG